ncbi:unnamed protein product [Prunus armeniaca]|uniref:Uncharacterized protein n=1 Tax=Prunus armeniaca TaxID=36596 RepID=A0A6J5VM65_PRUAR|nr:unnamed protein product [Prunus armeniaca]CAB4290066.1 unnamed protein product [Prunus armeniaca]
MVRKSYEIINQKKRKLVLRESQAILFKEPYEMMLRKSHLRSWLERGGDEGGGGDGLVVKVWEPS